MEKLTEGVSDMVYAIELLMNAIDRPLSEEEGAFLSETLTVLKRRKNLNMNEERLLVETLAKFHPSNEKVVTSAGFEFCPTAG